jgi:hypothetical protein
MDDQDFVQEYQRIKKDKKIISESTKSRVHSGLSKSSVNLFADYKDSPSKDNDIFGETPKKDVAQSKRNFSDLGDDGSLFSPSPAPNKCESKISPLMFESENQEFHKAFGEDSIISLRFESLTLNESKENVKKKEPEVRAHRRNSVKMLFKPATSKSQSSLTRSSSSLSHSQSSYDEMVSPFKSNVQKPPSCKDLFNSKGSSPRPNSPTSSSSDSSSKYAKSEPTLIPRRTPSNSGTKSKESQSEPNMFMDEDIDASQTPFRPHNRTQSRSFDMSTGPLRQLAPKSESFLVHHQKSERSQSFNVSTINNAIGNVMDNCLSSSTNLFGNISPSPRDVSFNSASSFDMSSSVGNGSTSGYSSLNSSRTKLDLNFQTRSDPGLDTHRSHSSHLINSSRGPDSSRSYDSVSRSSSRDGIELDRSFSRQGPSSDDVQTPFKPTSFNKSGSTGSLEGNTHLKISGKGSSRRAQELKRDVIFEDRSLLRLRAGSMGDLRRPVAPQLVMTKKRELNRQIVTNNSHTNRSPSDKNVGPKDWANHMFMKSSPPPSSNHSPLQSTSWSGS